MQESRYIVTDFYFYIKIMRILISCIVLLSTLGTTAQHIIKGKIKGSDENFTVYLKKFRGFNWVVLDSTQILKNKFEFKLINDQELLYLDTPANPSFYIKLYNEGGTTKISYDLNNHTYTIKGTEKNEGLAAFNDFMQPYIEELNNLTMQKPKISNPLKLTE